MKPVLILFLFCTSFGAAAQGPSAGTLRRFEAFPSAYVQPRNVDVWLPQGYRKGKKHAVLYMHDGQMLFDSSTTWNKQEWGVDETLSRLMRQNTIRDVIVVAIWSTNRRHSEYFPQKPLELLSVKDRESLLGALVDTPRSDNYLRFIVNELKPFIDSAFSTHSGQKQTFIAGSSMGGLISLYALCEYPEVFNGAACLSTHWPGGMKANNPIPQAFNIYLLKNLPPPQKHRIYFDHGTATLDSLYPPYQQMIDATMRLKGYGESWVTRSFPGEDHTERAWRRRFEIPALFLLEK